MLRFALNRSLKRLGRGLPVGSFLMAAEVALLAGQHIGRLDAHERRRLLALLGKAKGGPSALSEDDRSELGTLLSKLEPRLFVGSAARKLSPLPVPKRLAFGRRGSPARTAAAKRG
jgi:hypothetical protein